MYDIIVLKTKAVMELGFNSALVLQNIHFWVETNKAKNQNYHEGRYWTYNSVQALSKMFPVLTPKAIRYALEKLKSDGYILTGNFNKVQYDRTLWYTVTDKAFALLGDSICQKKQMEMWKMANGNVENGKPIPDVYHNNNSNIKKEKNKKEKKPPVESSVGNEPTLFSPTVKDTHKFDKHNLEADFEKLWQMYPCKQGKTKAYEKFVKAVKGGVEFSKIEDGLKRYNQYIKVHNVEREFIKHGSTWFNQRCWEDEYDLTPPKPKASVPEVKPPPKPYLYDDPMAGGRWVL